MGVEVSGKIDGGWRGGEFLEVHGTLVRKVCLERHCVI